MPLTMHLHLDAMGKLEDDPNVIGMFVSALDLAGRGRAPRHPRAGLAPGWFFRDEIRGRRCSCARSRRSPGALALFGAAQLAVAALPAVSALRGPRL